MNIKKLNEDSVLPAYETPGAAGLDLVVTEDYDIHPGAIGLLKTGLSIELEKDTCAFITPRSSTFKKYGLMIPNSPGLIDEDYRGELLIQVVNMTRQVCKINIGTKLAQLIIMPVKKVKLNEVTELSETERGEKGFGHTDKKE
jgi:dUTP pyrophosphatase